MKPKDVLLAAKLLHCRDDSAVREAAIQRSAATFGARMVPHEFDRAKRAKAKAARKARRKGRK